MSAIHTCESSESLFGNVALTLLAVMPCRMIAACILQVFQRYSSKKEAEPTVIATAITRSPVIKNCLNGQRENVCSLCRHNLIAVLKTYSCMSLVQKVVLTMARLGPFKSQFMTDCARNYNKLAKAILYESNRVVVHWTKISMYTDRM